MDQSSRYPFYKLPSPTARKYEDPAVRVTMELLQKQKQEQSLTPLEKKKKEIEAKQEELREATADGADHAKLMLLTYELKTLNEEYEALVQAENEKVE